MVVVLNPEHAQILANAGLQRADIQRELAARAVTPRSALAALNPHLLLGQGDPLPAVRNPANLLILTAGGAGLYSMVMPSWCAGPHGNVAVHAEIVLGQFCELP